MSDFLKLYFPAQRRLAKGTLALAAVCIAGCGSNYRPTTTPITPTGPAAQPTSYAFVVSAPSPATANGIGTLIDYSGDTVMVSAQIGPGPSMFALNAGGSSAWTVNSDSTISNIPVSTNLQEKNVYFTTLNTDPVVAFFSGAFGEYALDVQANQVDVLNGSPAASLKVVIPVDPSPVTMVGVGTVQRYYAVTQTIPYLKQMTLDGQQVQGGIACNIDAHSADLASFGGFADGIETSSNTVSSHIAVGVCPDYAVQTPDNRRVFVLNRGSDTVSVINSQINASDSCTPFKNQNGQLVTCYPTLPLSTTAVKALCPTPTAATCILPPNESSANLPAVAGPVYAEYNQATSQLVVANYEGNTINIIDVSQDEYGNDSSTFGTTYTVPVGHNPASVTVLADGSRAYVANQSDSTVTIVNLISHTVEKTLPVYGHPRTVVSTQNSLYGKVYVASPDSPYVTLIRTDQDIVDTTVLVQGNTVDVKITSPDALNNNMNTVSRLPGAGQPCNLPLSDLPASAITVANCKVQDATQLATPTVAKRR